MWLYVGSRSLRVLVVVALLGACYVDAKYVDPAILDACPGYTAANVKVQRDGLTADLVLAGKSCNVFGNDIEKLMLSVVYETGMDLCFFPFPLILNFNVFNIQFRIFIDTFSLKRIAFM
jgi:hypothetical protein